MPNTDVSLPLSSTFKHWQQQQHLLLVLPVVNMKWIKRRSRVKRRIEEDGVNLAILTVDILKVRNDFNIKASLMPSIARLPLPESFLVSSSRYRRLSRIRSWH